MPNAPPSPPRRRPRRRWVQGEYPQWLEAELRRAFGDRLLEEMAALQAARRSICGSTRLKATRDEVLARLQAERHRLPRPRLMRRTASASPATARQPVQIAAV